MGPMNYESFFDAHLTAIKPEFWQNIQNHLEHDKNEFSYLAKVNMIRVHLKSGEINDPSYRLIPLDQKGEKELLVLDKLYCILYPKGQRAQLLKEHCQKNPIPHSKRGILSDLHKLDKLAQRESCLLGSLWAKDLKGPYRSNDTSNRQVATIFMIGVTLFCAIADLIARPQSASSLLVYSLFMTPLVVIEISLLRSRFIDHQLNTICQEKERVFNEIKCTTVSDVTDRSSRVNYLTGSLFGPCKANSEGYQGAEVRLLP